MNSVLLDTSVPGVAVLTLEGEHELFSALKLQDRLASLIAQDFDVVVDLTQTVFIDSSIVAVLLKARDAARDAGVDYAVLVNESTGEPVRMFEITGLDRILPVAEKRAAARA